MDKNKIVMIAPVTVAAILILGILSGTAAAQLSKTVKSPYISKTVKSPYISKTVKSPYISKTVKSPYISKTVKTTFTARLAGNNEVPPINTPATGIARFELSSDGKVLNYHLSTTNLKGFKSGEICEKVSDYNYTTNKKLPDRCDGVATSLSMGKGKLTWQDLSGSFEDSSVSELVKSMRSGKFYVAVLTQRHWWYPPGTGEIIGQIRPG
jgi:hypothetical protein